MREFFSDKNFIKSKLLLLAKIILAITSLIFFLPLILLPFFNHPFADDYFNGYQLNIHGFVNYQSFMYLNWTGRFATTFVWSLFEHKNFLYTHYYSYSLLLLLLNFISIFFIVSAINKYAVKKLELTKTLLFSLVFLAVEICCLPECATFLFWFSSAITYCLPVILAQTEIALLIVFFNSKNKLLKNICVVVLPLLVFLTIGFNEVFILIQLLLFGILFYFKLYIKCSGIFILLMLLAFVISSALLVFAPGNGVRSSLIHSKPVFTGLAAIVYHSLETLWNIFKNILFWFIAALVFIYAGKIKFRNNYIHKLSRKTWFILPGIFIFLVVSVAMPVAALKGGIIPERYLNTVACFMLLLLLSYLFISGINNNSIILFKQSSTKKILIYFSLITGLLCNTYIADAYKSLLIAPTYNIILTEREAALKQAAQENKIAVVKDYNTALSEFLKTKNSSGSAAFQQLVQQKPPLLFFEDDLATDYSINVLIKYYGLDNIVVERK